MTNLEVINKYLYRAWRDNKLNYNLSQEMWNYTGIIPDMMPKYIEDYLKAPKLQQLQSFSHSSKAISVTINVINATLSPLMVKIFSKAFKAFLKEEDVYDEFIRYAFSESAKKWRKEQHYDNINVGDLSEYLNQCTFTYYIYRAWLWNSVMDLNGSNLNDKWFVKINQILMEEFKF